MSNPSHIQMNPNQIPYTLEIKPKSPEFLSSDSIFSIDKDFLNKQISKLLQSENKNENLMIVLKKVTITQEAIIFSLEKKNNNRLIHILKDTNKFLACSIDLLKVSKKYTKEILKHGFSINKEKYNFFAYSKSNLKACSCLFYQEKLEKMPEIMNKFGKFDKFQDISKKAARLSLLFSSSESVLYLKNEQIKVIDDIMIEKVCFSDGCGFISRQMAKEINKKLNFKEDYLPTVYQIRIQGCKGILLLNDEYKGKEIILRNSMIKFEAMPDILNDLIICGYSKPTTYACINQQIIMLLSGLGVKREYFLKKQQEYFDLLFDSKTDVKKTIELLKLLGKSEIIKKIIENDSKITNEMKSIITEEFYRNIKSKEGKNKLRIPLKSSRMIYGAVFDKISKNLKPNQIFLRITTADNKIQVIKGKVIVTKNPCYYVGDIRVMNAIDIEDPLTSCILDCIIFSAKGNVPVGSTMAGSDYDGDQYFVCWDQDLIPKYEKSPYNYPETTLSKLKREKITQEDLIDYFVNYDRFIVGKINNRFIDFANTSNLGVECEECIKLGTELFSKAIDAAKTGEKIRLPDYFNKKIENKETVKHVWVEMNERAEKIFLQELKDEFNMEWNITKEVLLDIINLYVENEYYNDYELFQLIKKWLLKEERGPIDMNFDLFEFIDFGHFNEKQLKEAKEILGVKSEYLKHFFHRSKIISKDIISYNYLNDITASSDLKWRLYYHENINNINFEILKVCLSKFPYCLLALKLDQNVKLLFFFDGIKTIPYKENYLYGEQLVSFMQHTTKSDKFFFIMIIFCVILMIYYKFIKVILKILSYG